MPVCAILTCKSAAEDSGGSRRDLSFHRFPKNEEVKKRWIELSGRENWVPNNTSYICSRHFRDTDYIIKRSGNRYLKVTAIPCEYVVYRHLFPDEEPAPETSEGREATPASSPTPTVLYPTLTLEADTTSNYDEFNVNDFNDNTIGWDQFQTTRHYEQPGPAPIMKRRSSTAGAPVKRKRGKKSKAKKRRQPRERSTSMETFQRQIEDVFAPMEEIHPMIEEAQPPLEDLLPMEDVVFPLEEVEIPMEEVHFPMEEVRPPTPDVRPPRSDPSEQINQIKYLIANHKSGRKMVETKLPSSGSLRCFERSKRGNTDKNGTERAPKSRSYNNGSE